MLLVGVQSDTAVRKTVRYFLKNLNKTYICSLQFSLIISFQNEFTSILYKSSLIPCNFRFNSLRNTVKSAVKSNF